jgi:hypothetical protein
MYAYAQVTKAACIVVKLLVDLWLATPPAEAAALAAPLLHAALAEAAPARRARAFDLLYNLALHAHMLEPDSNGHGGVAGTAASGAAGSGAAPKLLWLAERERMQPRVLCCAARHGAGESEEVRCLAASMRTWPTYAHCKVSLELSTFHSQQRSPHQESVAFSDNELT